MIIQLFWGCCFYCKKEKKKKEVVLKGWSLVKGPFTWKYEGNLSGKMVLKKWFEQKQCGCLGGMGTKVKGSHNSTPRK